MARPRTAPKTAAEKTMEGAYPREFRIAENIRALMLRNRMGRAELAEYLGISGTTVWRKLTKHPWEITITELYALCDLWGVTLDTFQRDPYEQEGNKCAGHSRRTAYSIQSMKPENE